jgi:hypothetical protein
VSWIVRRCINGVRECSTQVSHNACEHSHRSTTLLLGLHSCRWSPPFLLGIFTSAFSTKSAVLALAVAGTGQRFRASGCDEGGWRYMISLVAAVREERSRGFPGSGSMLRLDEGVGGGSMAPLEAGLFFLW